MNFAAALRSLREQAGEPSLAQMSQRSGVCIASLSDAHSGIKLPTWRTVRGYISACGIHDTTAWRSRWDDVLLSQHTERASSTHAALMKRWASTQQVTPPQWIKDEVELARLLDQMRRFRGLSLRDLARRSAGFSHHTYGAVLRGDRPVTTDVLLAMLQACRVDRGAAQRWLGQLARVRPAEALRVSGLMAKFDTRRARGISPHRGFRGPRVAAAR